MEGYSFGRLFKKFKLKAEFHSLSDFGRALGDEGFFYEESMFSHWQKNRKIPKNRKLLLAIIKIFAARNAVSIKDANLFLESAGTGHLTERETKYISETSNVILQPPSAKKLVKFLTTVGNSKRIKRTGWIREKIKNPESLAEHSFIVSILAMTLAEYLGADKERLIHMAILHDLGEIITGDLVWSRGEVLDIKKLKQKEELEKLGIGKIFKLIGKSDSHLVLFEEMIERKTREAKIFWQLDKLEMALQALDYESRETKKLDEFFINADLQIEEVLLRKIFDEIVRQRPKL